MSCCTSRFQQATLGASTTVVEHNPTLERKSGTPKVWRYSRTQIADLLFGERWSIFNRAFLPEFCSLPNKIDNAEEYLADTFCSIVVDDIGQLDPPNELWTMHNIDQLEANIGRVIPMFRRDKTKAQQYQRYELCGCFRITGWTLYRGQSDEVVKFIDRLRMQKGEVSKTAYSKSAEAWPYSFPSHRSKETEVLTWEAAVDRRWARVELEEVIDPILSGNRNRKYVIRYIFSVLSKAPLTR